MWAPVGETGLEPATPGPPGQSLASDSGRVRVRVVENPPARRREYRSGAQRNAADHRWCAQSKGDRDPPTLSRCDRRDTDPCRRRQVRALEEERTILKKGDDFHRLSVDTPE